MSARFTPRFLASYVFVLTSMASCTGTHQAAPELNLTPGACAQIPAHPEAEKLLHDYTWVVSLFEQHRRGTPSIVLEGCETVIETTRRAISKSLQKGLSCLSAMGSARNRDASQLLSLLSYSLRPVRVYCAVPGALVQNTSIRGKLYPFYLPERVNGTAATCEGDQFPSLTVSKQSSEALLEKTIFHEMLHWLGYRHGHAFDVTYLAEICCIGDPAKEASKSACSLLQDSPQWRSAEYAHRFAHVMTFARRGVVALGSAWGSVLDDPINMHNSNNIYLAAMEDGFNDSGDQNSWRATGRPFFALAFAEAALPLLSSADRTIALQEIRSKLTDRYFRTAPGRRALASKVAAVLSAALARNSEALYSAILTIGRQKNTCHSLSVGEREALDDIKSVANMQITRVLGDQQMQEFPAWKNLCNP